MTKEMQDLINLANQGDTEGQYELGWAYMYGEDGFGKDSQEAHKWLKLAADKGHPRAQRHFAYLFIDSGSGNHLRHDPVEAEKWLKKSGDSGDLYALRTLINLYALEFKGDHTERLIDCLTKLIELRKDPVAMVELGAILCGEYGRFLDKFPGVAGYYDPKRGYGLIEEGIRAGESASENPIGFSEYSAAHGAYHVDTRKAYKPELAGSRYFTGKDFIVAVAKKVVYAEKALASINSPNLPYPQEVVGELTTLWEKMLESAKGELESVKKAEESRADIMATLEEISRMME